VGKRSTANYVITAILNIFIPFFHSLTALLSLGFLIVEVSRLQSVEHTTLGMTPLDE
jgi:hypothetical protein